MATNAQIATAVLLKWGEPIIPVLTNTYIGTISSKLSPIENFIKKIGIAGQNWSIQNDISNIVAMGGTKVIQPFLLSAISKMPEDMIPSIFHNIVNGAIEKGELSIFDGNIKIEKADLEELKKYLDFNLPYKEEEAYNIIIPNSNK